MMMTKVNALFSVCASMKHRFNNTSQNSITFYFNSSQSNKNQNLWTA